MTTHGGTSITQPTDTIDAPDPAWRPVPQVDGRADRRRPRRARRWARATGMVGVAALAGASAASVVVSAPAGAYEGAGSTWNWSTSVTNISNTSIDFSDTVQLDSWFLIVGCSNAWFSGTSHVTAPNAYSVTLADDFWGNSFGPGSIFVGWPPGASLNNSFDPGAWTDTFSGDKGTHTYNRLNMHLPDGTTFTGVNHSIKGSGNFGAFGVLLIGSANRGTAVC